MDRTARLDLAVRVRLASIRADRVRERTASLDRQYMPVARAIEQHVQRAAAASEAAEAARAGGGDGRPSEDDSQVGGLHTEDVRFDARIQTQRVMCPRRSRQRPGVEDRLARPVRARIRPWPTPV